MIKILKGDDATHVVAIDLPEAAYADGVLIEFALGDLRLLMPSAPRVTLKFPASWTATQPCGRQLGNFTLISPAGERAAITKTYPVYITNDTSAVGTAGSISGNIIPAIDFSDLPSLDAMSTPGDTKAVLNEILRRLKACCITLAMVLAVPFLGLAAEVKTAPLDAVGGTDSDAEYLQTLRLGKTYYLDDRTFSELHRGMYVTVVGRQRMSDTVVSFFGTNRCVLSPYAALACAGLQDYRSRTGESRFGLVLSERSPMCDAGVAAEALGIEVEMLKKYV
jgi:hypothetical protein